MAGPTPIEERIVAREARITEILGRGAIEELTDNDLRAINHFAHVEYYGRFESARDPRIAAALQRHIDRLHEIEAGEDALTV